MASIDNLQAPRQASSAVNLLFWAALALTAVLAGVLFYHVGDLYAAVGTARAAKAQIPALQQRVAALETDGQVKAAKIDAALADRSKVLQTVTGTLAANQAALREAETALAPRKAELATIDTSLAQHRADLETVSTTLSQKAAELATVEAALAPRRAELATIDAAIAQRQTDLKAATLALATQQALLAAAGERLRTQGAERREIDAQKLLLCGFALALTDYQRRHEMIVSPLPAFCPHPPPP